MAAKPKAKPEYRVHDLDINDALNLSGIISGGGLAGEAQNAISQIQSGAQAAGINAVARLLMGVLANVSTRDQMRGFLFDVWKTDEDQRATEEDLNLQDRLEPRFARENGALVYHPNTGEPVFDRNSLYYKKLKRFNKLPPKALIGLLKALYDTEGFSDFLQSLKDMLSEVSPANTSTATSTSSSESTVSRIKQ